MDKQFWTAVINARCPIPLKHTMNYDVCISGISYLALPLRLRVTEMGHRE